MSLYTAVFTKKQTNYVDDIFIVAKKDCFLSLVSPVMFAGLL